MREVAIVKKRKQMRDCKKKYACTGLKSFDVDEFALSGARRQGSGRPDEDIYFNE